MAAARPRAQTPGERWAHELMADLRRGRYSPSAWRSFFGRSFARARVTRARRPELDRQSRRWAIAWLAASLAVRRRGGRWPQVPAGPELAWGALILGMLRWHLGMVEGPRGERRLRLSPADAVTLARFWLVPRLAATVGRPEPFLGLLAAGSACDVADGALARRHGPTRLGRDLDRSADLCFFGTAVAVAARAGWTERWAARAFGLRYGIELGYLVGHYFMTGAAPRPRARLARAATPLFVLGLAAAAGQRRRLGSTAVGTASLAILGDSVRFRRSAARAGS